MQTKPFTYYIEIISRKKGWKAVTLTTRPVDLIVKL